MSVSIFRSFSICWETYFKELAFEIIEVVKSEIRRVGHQAGDQGRTWGYNSSLEAFCCHNSLLLGGGQSYYIWAFNWLNEAHPHYKGHWLYSKSPILNVIEKYLHRHIQNNVWPVSGYSGPVKLTIKSTSILFLSYVCIYKERT